MFKENRLTKEIGESSNKKDQSPHSGLEKIRSDNLRRLGINPKEYYVSQADRRAVTAPTGNENDASSTQFGDLPGEIKHKIFDHSVQNIMSNETNTKKYIKSLDQLVQARLTEKKLTGQEAADILLNHLYEDKIHPEFVKATVKVAYLLHPNREKMLLELDQIIKNEQADLKKLCGAAKAMSFLLPEGSASGMCAEVKEHLVEKLTATETETDEHGNNVTKTLMQRDERSYVTKTLLYPSFNGQREVVNTVCDRNFPLDARKDMIKVIGDTKDTKMKPLFNNIARKMRIDTPLLNEIGMPVKKAYETLPNTTGVFAAITQQTFDIMFDPPMIHPVW